MGNKEHQSVWGKRRKKDLRTISLEIMKDTLKYITLWHYLNSMWATI